MFKKETILAMFIGIILASVVIFFLWWQDNETVKNNVGFQELGSTKNEEIIGWENYSNEDYGFVIKYPPGWDIEKINKSGVYSHDDKIIKIVEFSTIVNGNNFDVMSVSINYFPHFSSKEKAAESEKQKIIAQEGWKDPYTDGETKLGEIEGYTRMVTPLLKLGLFDGMIYINDKIGNGVYRIDMQYNALDREGKELLDLSERKNLVKNILESFSFSK